MKRTKKDIELELLFLRLKKRNSAAFMDLISVWERPLFYFVRRIVPTEEDAWDVLQETWLKVYRHCAQIQSYTSMPAWMYKIARNCAIDLLRKEKKFVSVDQSDDQLSESEESVDMNLETVNAIDLHHALLQLSLPQCEAVTLHFLEDFSIHEIAEIINVSPGTVKSRLHYAKLALKHLLTHPDEKGIEDG